MDVRQSLYRGDIKKNYEVFIVRSLVETIVNVKEEMFMGMEDAKHKLDWDLGILKKKIGRI